MHIVSPSGQPVELRASGGSSLLAGSGLRVGTPGPTAIPMISAINGPQRCKRLYELYISNPWLFATVDMLATGNSRVVMEVHEPDSKGNSNPVPVHVAPSAGRPDATRSLVNLLQEPMPGMSWHTWSAEFTRERKLYGNALALIRRPSLGAMPNELRLIPWPWVSVAAVDGVILYYEVTFPSRRAPERFMPDEVIHWGRSIGREGAWGCSPSPIEALQHTMRLYDVIARHLEHFFKNSARLSGHLKLDTGGNKSAATLREEASLLQELLEEFYSGAENAGKVLTTTGTWQSVSADPKSAALVELKKLAREEIVAVYHVPPPLAGILESAIKSNVVELRSQYLRDVVGPVAQEFAQELMIQLLRRVPQWRALTLRPDMDSPLRPDLEARATVYEKMRHVWTTNEMRALEGLPPLELAGDYALTTWMPSGQVPLGLVQPQTQAQEYGKLPTDADGVGDVSKPVAQPAEPAPAPQRQEGGADVRDQQA